MYGSWLKEILHEMQVCLCIQQYCLSISLLSLPHFPYPPPTPSLPIQGDHIVYKFQVVHPEHFNCKTCG